MEQKCAEIESNHRIKTKWIVFDFAKDCTIQDYQQKIGDVLKGYDVAMLFLNAGYFAVGPFRDLAADRIQNTVAVNAL